MVESVQSEQQPTFLGKCLGCARKTSVARHPTRNQLMEQNLYQRPFFLFVGKGIEVH